MSQHSTSVVPLDPFRYRRRRTRVVMVGDVAIGGDNPIRVQSMTTTRTQDIEATAAQAERLVGAGCEIVRITAPTVRDAMAIGAVRDTLRTRGIRVPLVADIHFSPEAALGAADYVDKVRINPGNYADSRKFAVREYTDADYAAELARIDERVTPLILKLKERGIALRIGTNHGSLSDRITNRYGDTPRGMVESALEFVRICERHGYRDIILSMKASNPKVMIEAYRLLAVHMVGEGMDYPFHLGVTEAGNGEDARIKSAVGIGALLLDGIGDTIRVSLAEEPENEVPVARALAELLPRGLVEEGGTYGDAAGAPPFDPLEYVRRAARTVTMASVAAGGEAPVAVLTPLPRDRTPSGHGLPMVAGGVEGRGPRPDAVTVDVVNADDVQRLGDLAWKGPGRARRALLARGSEARLLTQALPQVDGVYLVIDDEVDANAVNVEETPLVSQLVHDVHDSGKAIIAESSSVESLLGAARIARSCDLENIALALRADGVLDILHGYRLLASRLNAEGLDAALHLRYSGSDPLLPASAVLGSLLCDGIGDLSCIEEGDGAPLVASTFNLLQATGRRITKTDYVACPSCGRTLFDLQTTTDRIKERTAHLVGVKIAVMGCVVNGPGEMADADFGYVGGAPGKVNLYVGKECVERNVPEDEAADRLVTLIKARGRWAEAQDD